MAKAKSTNPDYAVSVKGERPEPNHAKSSFIVKLTDGTIVERVYMTNGNVQETPVFAADFAEEALAEDQVAAKLKASKGE